MTTLPVSLLECFPIQELDRVEAFLQSQACKKLDGQTVDGLKRWHFKLSGTLNRLTGIGGNVVSLRASEFVCRGVIHSGWGLGEIYVDVLTLLWQDFPDMRKAMAVALMGNGYFNPHVAESLEALFPRQTLAYAKQHSQLLPSGWYVDTIVGKREVRPRLASAVRASGLRWGVDVIVPLRTISLPVTRQTL